MVRFFKTCFSFTEFNMYSCTVPVTGACAWLAGCLARARTARAGTRYDYADLAGRWCSIEHGGFLDDPSNPPRCTTCTTRA